MNPKELKDAIDTLCLLEEAERTVADYYSACAELFTGERSFWDTLVAEERSHADRIKKIITAVQNGPNDFEPGRRFNSLAVKTFMSGLRSDTELVKNMQVTMEKALIIARDIENSLLEFKYAEIVKSGNIEFKRFAQEIVKDTQSHKKVVDDKIAAGINKHLFK